MYHLHADKTNIHKIISFIQYNISFIISINIMQIVINMRMTMHFIRKKQNLKRKVLVFNRKYSQKGLKIPKE